MIVQACLNGARPLDWHPALPTHTESLVAEGISAVSAGAAELHVHPRGPDGRESLAADVIGGAVSALRAEMPGTLVGVSTGAWIEQDADRTLAAIGEWRVLPDYASVNLSEMGAPSVIERLLRIGVGVEAGLASRADAERLLSLGLAARALRILIEIDEQDATAAIATADDILRTLGPSYRPILLHGADATVWMFVRRAAERRFSTRVGLEDGMQLPDGNVATGNGDLVAAACTNYADGTLFG